MHVSGLHSRNLLAHHTRAATQFGAAEVTGLPKLARTEAATDPIEVRWTSPAVIDEPVETPGSDTGSVVEDAATKTKGVIRLLEQGHFRGVADVRLRINFHDELNGVEAETVTAAAQERVGALAESVNQRIDALLSTGALSDDQAEALHGIRTDFQEAVDAALESSTKSEGIAKDELVSGLSSAYESLVTSIEELVSAATAEEQTSGRTKVPTQADSPLLAGTVQRPATTTSIRGLSAVTAPEPSEVRDNPEGPAEVDSGIALQTLLADLAGLVPEAINGIDEMISTTAVLPPLSEPQGNGVAYDKFLAIYRDMILPTATPTESVDQLA